MFYFVSQYLRVPLKENDVNMNHLSALRTKHAELEQKLEREENRPSPDAKTIHDLKKQKLHLKDLLAHDLSSAH
jgi:hypothetical protein